MRLAACRRFGTRLLPLVAAILLQLMIGGLSGVWEVGAFIAVCALYVVAVSYVGRVRDYA